MLGEKKRRDIKKEGGKKGKPALTLFRREGEKKTREKEGQKAIC